MLTQTQAARAAGVAPNLDYMIETWTDSEDWRAPQELQVSRKLVLSWAHADASGARRRRRAYERCIRQGYLYLRSIAPQRDVTQKDVKD